MCEIGDTWNRIGIDFIMHKQFSVVVNKVKHEGVQFQGERSICSQDIAVIFSGNNDPLLLIKHSRSNLYD